MIDFALQYPGIAAITGGSILLLIAAGIAYKSGQVDKAREYLERILKRLGV